MVDVNVTVTVPAFEKLVNVVASGIGAVAGPILAPWTARQHAKARLIEAGAQAGSLQTIAQAQASARRALTAPNATSGTVEITPEQIVQRLKFQEQKRQQNIVSVVSQAAEELGDEEVRGDEPDHDWTARFFEYVQDVSEEDIRTIWARILAGEVRTPGRVSLRTLSILRNMSRLEAELFTEAMRYVIDDFIVWQLCVKSSDRLDSNDFYFRFVDMGLLYSPVESRPPRRFSLGRTGTAQLVNADRILILRGTPNRSIDTDSDKAVLKRPAIELSSFCEAKSDPIYLRHIARRLASKDCTLQTVPIEETTPDGHRFDPTKIRTVEPI